MRKTAALRATGLASALLLGATLTGCDGGSSQGAGSSTVPSAGVTRQSQPSPSSAGAANGAGGGTSGGVSSGSSAASAGTSGAQTATPRPCVPADAYPGAGGPRPANATPLTESNHSEYGAHLAFITPSQKNGCDITDHFIRCGTMGAAGGEYFMSLDGHVLGREADDTPGWLSDTDTLSYGEVRYSGTNVFAVTTSGITVWNTQTGKGALINTSGVTTF